jgi:NACalpha-BTF3-like transcription factor
MSTAQPFEDDIKIIMDQAQVSRVLAIKALNEHG